MNELMRRLEVAPENRGLLATMYFAFFTNGMMTVILGALLPALQADYGLNYAQSGLLLSANQAGNILAVLLAGALPYLLGRKKTTLIMVSGVAIGMLCITLTGNVVVLLLAFIVTGLSRGTVSNIANVTIATVSGNKISALNILHAVFAVGALLGPVIMYVCQQGLALSWKSASLVVAALGLAMWVLMAFSKLDNTPMKRGAKGETKFLKMPAFWLNTAVLFFYICAETSIIGWFVSYVQDAGILPANVAQFTSTIVWLMILVGRLVCGTLLSNFNKPILLLFLGLAFTGFFAGMLVSGTNVMSIICLGGIGFSMAGIYPTTMASMPGTSSAVTIGLSIGVASIGGIIMPSIVGSVADSIGLAGGISTVMVALGFMLLLMLAKVIWAKKIG
ncbi:MFS transporter [Ruminococcaceae bacterium OttesenSCG-928-A16]|nr:MFS transporter [Ruminococcaceae bacterium OttesenSCG-928-A16]